MFKSFKIGLVTLTEKRPLQRESVGLRIRQRVCGRTSRNLLFPCTYCHPWVFLSVRITLSWTCIPDCVTPMIVDYQIKDGFFNPYFSPRRYMT